jgi:hypothetical protein
MFERRRTFELPQTLDHEPVGLAGKRRRQDGVTLGIAREPLRERNQFLPAKRRLTTNLFLHPGMIARSRPLGNLNVINPAEAGSHVQRIRLKPDPTYNESG